MATPDSEDLFPTGDEQLEQPPPAAVDPPSERRRFRQGLLNFFVGPSDAGTAPDSGSTIDPSQSKDQQPRPPPTSGSLFGPPAVARHPDASAQSGRSSRQKIVRHPKYERTLFDFANDESAATEPAAPVPVVPVGSDDVRTRDLAVPLTADVWIASGERAKARDNLAAIRVLQSVERDRRAATPDERATLARFAGFGPVALSIFPDPTTERFKDAHWQQLGEELRSLLSPDEYDSAKRTTYRRH